jgi:hypothetical protein
MQCSWGITKSQNLIHKCRKMLHSEKNLVECNIRVGIIFQRYFNLGDKMQVWTVCLLFWDKNDKMWSRTQSGNIIEHQTCRTNFHFVLKIQVFLENYSYPYIPILEFFHYEAFCYIYTFVYKILTLRDTSIAQHALDLVRLGTLEPLLLKNILYYICSHNTHIQQFEINVNDDSNLIMSCVSSCRALT